MSDGIPSPNPEFTQQIKNVTGNSNVKIQNKNLASLRTDLSCYGGTVTDTVIINNDTGKVISTLIPIKSNTTYTLYKEKSTPISSSRFFYYDREPIINETTSIGGNYLPAETNYVLQFTTPATAKWLYVRWSNNNDTNPCGNVQILEGAYTSQTIPSYVPHQEQNYPFTFSEGQRAMQGTELKDDGIHNKRKQVVLDGTENWVYHSEVDGVYRYSLNSGSFLNKFVGIKTGTNAGGDFRDTFCNYFYYVYGNLNKAFGSFSINNVGAANWIFVQTNFEDLATFKQWLATKYANGTPVIVEYELAESELESNIISYNSTQASQYEAIKNARSYDDITYITSTSDEEGFDMSVVAIGDANKIQEQQNNEIETIKSRLDLLEG